MALSNKKQDDDLLKWLEEDDPFGLEEEMEIVIFKCMDCGKEDEVPEYIIGEFSFDLKEGEEVELQCPFCEEGTMREARDVPSE